MIRQRWCVAVFMVVVILALAGAAHAANPSFNLKSVDSNFSTDRANGWPFVLIDNDGDLAGRGRNNYLDHGLFKGWFNVAPIDLGANVTPVKIIGELNGNGAPMVAGFKYTDNVTPAAFRWDYSTGKMETLDSLGGSSKAYGMNNSGVIVGPSVYSPNHNGSYGCIWFPNQPIRPMFNLFDPWDINDSNQIVGENLVDHQAVLYDLDHQQTITTLGLLPGGTQSCAHAINNNGQVVGWSWNGTRQIYQGFIWDQDNKMRPLDPTGTIPNTPWAINNKGKVAGTATDPRNGGRQYGFLWTPAYGMLELNDCLDSNLYSGWNIISASGINDDGVIVGTAYYSGQFYAILLTPNKPLSAGMAAVITHLLFTKQGNAQ